MEGEGIGEQDLLDLGEDLVLARRIRRRAQLIGEASTSGFANLIEDVDAVGHVVRHRSGHGDRRGLAPDQRSVVHLEVLTKVDPVRPADADLVEAGLVVPHARSPGGATGAVQRSSDRRIRRSPGASPFRPTVGAERLCPS